MKKIFYVDFVDGHVIAQIIKIYSGCNNFIFEFYEDKIKLSTEYLPKKSRILFSIDIKAENTLLYSFNRESANCREEGYHVVRMSNSQFRQQMGSVGKGAGIILHQSVNEPRRVEIIIHSESGSSRGNISLEPIENYTNIQPDEGFSRSLSLPNFKVPVKFLTKAAKDMNRFKGCKTNIIVCGHQFVIECLNNSGTINKFSVYDVPDISDEGNLDDSRMGEYQSYAGDSGDYSEGIKYPINKTIMSTFMNMNGLVSGGGIVSVYSEIGNEVLRLNTPAGYYGTLKMYITPIDE